MKPTAFAPDRFEERAQHEDVSPAILASHGVKVLGNGLPLLK